jgi:hypothetical protein
MNRTAGKIAVCLFAVAVSIGRADDIVVEDAAEGVAGGGQGMAFPQTGVDLVQMFDSQAFADGQGFGAGMVVVNGRVQGAEQPPADNDAVVAQRLEPISQRLQARIKMVDRIVGLDAKQRGKLEIAAQSDLRRLTATVAEARAKYAGKTLQLDRLNGGFGAETQRAVQEVQQDATRCRELIGQAVGAGSLLAKVIPGTLDDAQATKYQAVMDARRDCRWQAAVATVLAQLDDTLGFTQQQHDALKASLLAAPPAADELDGGSPLQAEPAVGLVAARLTAAVGGDAQLAAVLDPRQRAAVAAGVMQANAWQGFAGQVIAPAVPVPPALLAIPMVID